MVLQARLQVDGERLNRTLAELASIGQLPNGGVCRLAFSPEDLQARDQVQAWMLAADMTVRVDAAGNLIGRLAGADQKTERPAIATGSHIDTVPLGGWFDGVLGVLAGIEVARTLQETHTRLKHPFEVIVFADEESSMVGCKAMAGTLTLGMAADNSKFGVTLARGVSLLGGDWELIESARRTRQEICAFVELHVEQGCVLEAHQRQVGIVQGVVGAQRHRIVIEGRSNHAGTTPMEMRQDALVAAAQIVLAVEELAKAQGQGLVATVGSLKVWPNAINVVPGQVEIGLDVRDLSLAAIEQFMVSLKGHFWRIEQAMRVKISITPLLAVAPTLAAQSVQAAIATTCHELNLSTMELPSRAGHDAQEMGRFTDMGMIFVPSQEGLSHSEHEYTAPELCTVGANVLLKTILHLDTLYL
jgi:N-carbamoyl-L-amino-acid hydrolase